MNSNRFEKVMMPRGVLVIVGGHEYKGEAAGDDNKEVSRTKDVLAAFVKLTEKKHPIIEVITTGSSVGNESFKDYQKSVYTARGKLVISHCFVFY